MTARRPDCKVGVEVHASGKPKQLGVIVKVHEKSVVDVQWADGTTTTVHSYLLTDVASKRRAAERAAQRWAGGNP